MPPDFARYIVGPGEDVSLAEHDPAATGGYSPDEARAELDGLVERIADLQARLSPPLGRLRGGLRGHAALHEHRRGALVRRTERPQVVLVVARAVAGTLDAMDPRWPEPEEDLEAFAAGELDQLSASSRR